jgi:hypothetical protein
MRSAIFILGNLATVLLAVIGVAAGDDQLATWAHWLTVLHDHQWATLGILLLAALIFAFTWSEFLAERKVEKAGGRTKKEFPFKREWRKVKNFPIWQVAWLWCDLEPYSEKTDLTPAYATFRKLKEDLAGGFLEDAKKDKTGSWMGTTFSRQQLIDYAIKIGERPRFLFYQLPLAHKIALAFGIRPADPDNYRTISSRQLDYFACFQGQQPKAAAGTWQETIASIKTPVPSTPAPNPLELARGEIRRALVAGELDGIARREIGGLFFYFERIPMWAWKRVEWDYVGFRWRGRSYEHLMLRQTTTEPGT